MARVLVADDNSNIQKMAANALKDLGIEVIGVSNGESAVKKMPDFRPDLILADVFMPVRDGYELCDWIKKNENYSHIPVFLLVGAFDPLDEHRVQAVKADGIIKKPFVPPDRLITVVQAMLERAAQHKTQQRHAASLKETHDHFAQHVPHVEETQKLSEQEVNAMIGRDAPAAAAPPSMPMPAPESDPEPVEFSTRAPQIDLGETNEPVFMMGEAPAETPAPPSFQASSIEEEPPPSYDIKEAQREPSPDLPPIKVDFSGPSEPLELVRDDHAAYAASAPMENARLEELVTNPSEWTAPPPPVAPAAPEPPPLEASLPPMPVISVPAVVPPPPAPAPLGVPSRDLPGLDWHPPEAAAASAAVSAPPPPPPAAPPPPPPEVQRVPDFAAAPQVNPYVVDEVVDRVMLQLQPQIIHKITTEVGKALEMLQPRILDQVQRDVIRPLAEELLRNSGKK